MRQGEYDVEVRDAEEFFLSCGEPALASLCLALGTVPVPAGNGEISITCIGLNRYAVFAWHQHFNAKSPR
jgi:hypothetical protein